jgi:hypothetical protein
MPRVVICYSLGKEEFFMNTRTFLPGCAALAVLVLGSPAPSLAQAQEVDFSCMSLQVLGKIQTAERYKEYDVVLKNQCPGPVYWSMCIERLDPQTQQIIETHNPGGYLENDKKSRVNLQMKKTGTDGQFRQRFQEFYVNVGYGVEGVADPQCVAKQCESEKSELRGQFRANQDAWNSARQQLAAKLAAECQDSGWDKTEDVKKCRAEIRAATQPELERFERRDAELRERIVAGYPAYCEVHAGDLVPQ